MSEKCFVIMPIGTQEFGTTVITEAELKARYTDLIREAIEKASPGMEVIRADELPSPGAITRDVFELLRNADFVVADITYPNPNVFYELGLRHAYRRGTLLIKGTGGPRVPFDIAGLRHTPYENTPTGLKTLSRELARCFTSLRENPNKPDNEFLAGIGQTTGSPDVGQHPSPGVGQYEGMVYQMVSDNTAGWGFPRVHGLP